MYNHLVSVQGYNLLRYDREDKKRGGGLCVYLKSGIEYEVIRKGISNENCELLSVKVSSDNQKDILVVLMDA